MSKSEIAKAKAVISVAKGSTKVTVIKVRTKPRFYRPKTAVYKRSPKYPNTLVDTKKKVLDEHKILIRPLYSQAVLVNFDKNCVTYLVHIKANKIQIKEAFAKKFNARVSKVNTLITPDMRKKAFIFLDKSVDAYEIADKLKIFTQ